jgi:predicted DNA-binding transcriptional regulator YafY
MEHDMAISSQLSRQWQLLRILENFRFGISIDDLATKVERSRRTVERDLNTLRQLGFPIISETMVYSYCTSMLQMGKS